MTRPALAHFYGRQVSNPAHGEHWAGPPEMVERIAGIVGTRSTDRVLDVGCGTGGPARRLAAMLGCRVVAVDVLPLVLPARAPDAAGGPRYSAADAAALPLAAASFDQLWSLGAIAHVGDVARFAREAARVLRPEGVGVVTEAFWDGVRPPRFRRTAPRPWHPRTVAAVAGELAAAGFAEVDVRRWPGDPHLSGVQRPPGSPAPAGGHGPATTGDGGLDADLRDGRLTPAMVVARRPRPR